MSRRLSRSASPQTGRMSRVAPPLYLSASTPPPPTEQPPPLPPHAVSAPPARTTPPAPVLRHPLPPPPTLPLPVQPPPSPPPLPLPSAQPLPRLIWAYWHEAAEASLPAAAAACVASWRRHAPEWQVRPLDSNTYDCSRRHLRLQPPPHTVAACTAYGCRCGCSTPRRCVSGSTRALTTRRSLGRARRPTTMLETRPMWPASAAQRLIGRGWPKLGVAWGTIRR